MLSTVHRRMLWLILFVLVAAGGWANNPQSAAAMELEGVCADDGGKLPKPCTKEVRIYNNTANKKIWAILQASKQETDAFDCPKSQKGGGDVWLQVALGKTDECLSVKSNYYAFVNGTKGIGSDKFVSVDLPWWSKRKNVSAQGDRYIDWWRGARVILIDDETAFREVYDALSGNSTVPLASGSPRPKCNNDMKGNRCDSVEVYEVTQEGEVGAHLPFQLNEFTFGGICKVNPDGTFLQSCLEDYDNQPFINFNQNYNVSNVDQVYLPVAMGPVRGPGENDIGYMGTTMKLNKFRQRLKKFTNVDDEPNDPDWPVYNNPNDGSGKMYPNAGIRVPSPYSIFTYYQNPSKFPDGNTPVIIPEKNPKLIKNMIKQWDDCTSDNPNSCEKMQENFYKSVDTVFKANYKNYLDTCDNIPGFLDPVGDGTRPKWAAYLAPIYGWVPFNVNCGNKELPIILDPPPASAAMINYWDMQYNYEDLPGMEGQWFNPYTRLIHDDEKTGGLGAAAYAFSIDDQSSFLSNDGGSTPGGLIFTVGGPKGLENEKEHAPPVPEYYAWYMFAIGLGGRREDDNGYIPGPYWKKYGLCSEEADRLFATEVKGGHTIGINPARTKINKNNPCPITLEDTAGQMYRFIIKKAKAPGDTLPQKKIWPDFIPSEFGSHDPEVVGCPAVDGFVPPLEWCARINQEARPNPNSLAGRVYSIGTPPPLQR